jgi:hypothetical protein
VVAYDEASDMVLVMDAALHKNRWYFISVKKLYEAMNTKDGEKYLLIDVPIEAGWYEHVENDPTWSDSPEDAIRKPPT